MYEFNNINEKESKPANQYTKVLRSESEQSKKPIEKVVEITGRSTDTISKINQL
ncbi:MAG: hypothetical protein HOM80_06535 [Bacteroidetes bacterium]|nr:hypothetical protein [Bacteroidota bacterium]